MRTFENEVGTKEEGGDNHGERVEEYLASTDLGPGYPWCAAFITWGFNQHGIENPESAWSPSWFPESNTIYVRGKDDNQEPKPGDVIGIWFDSLGRIGHVGFITGWHERYVISVEGNTNDQNSRLGDGVYRKRRIKRQIYTVSRWLEDYHYTLDKDNKNPKVRD